MTGTNQTNLRHSTWRERLDRLHEVFKGEDRVLIVISADPDAIASALALKRLLWRRVSAVTVARTNVISRPDNLALLHFLKLPLPHLDELDRREFNRLAMVDSQPHHFSGQPGLRFDLVMDHHPLGKNSARFVDVRPDYGATATMMTEYLRAARIKPSRPLATALYYAIKTDTDNFVRQGQLEDVRAFRFLFPLKSQNLISKIEHADITRSALKYFHQALETVKLRRDTALLYAGRVDNPDTLVMLADFFLRVRDVNRSIAAGLFKERLVVIFRLADIRQNAGRLASSALGEFGSAGGHKSMARAEIPLANLDPKLLEKDGSMERFLIRRLKEGGRRGDVKSTQHPAGPGGD
ncbi:MAG: DHH family phosphoesterase [Thermodesulfobacteriota bacterium]